MFKLKKIVKSLVDIFPLTLHLFLNSDRKALHFQNKFIILDYFALQKPINRLYIPTSPDPPHPRAKRNWEILHILHHELSCDIIF